MFPQRLDPEGYPKKGSTHESLVTLSGSGDLKIDHFGVVKIQCSFDGFVGISDFYVRDVTRICHIRSTTRYQFQARNRDLSRTVVRGEFNVILF
jgi:hypothetical protein